MLAGKGKDTLLLLTVSLHGHWHHRAMGDTRERLALSGSRIPDSLLGLLWHQPIEKCTLLLIGVGEVQVSHLTWFLLAPQVEGNLMGMKGSAYHLAYQLMGMKGSAYHLAFSESEWWELESPLVIATWGESLGSPIILCWWVRVGIRFAHSLSFE